MQEGRKKYFHWPGTLTQENSGSLTQVRGSETITSWKMSYNILLPFSYYVRDCFSRQKRFVEEEYLTRNHQLCTQCKAEPSCGHRLQKSYNSFSDWSQNLIFSFLESWSIDHRRKGFTRTDVWNVQMLSALFHVLLTRKIIKLQPDVCGGFWIHSWVLAL